MSKWIIEVEVDDEKLINSDPSEGEEQEEEMEGHISREMQWVADSGIYVTSITQIVDDTV
jgi:hypothetical protein